MTLTYRAYAKINLYLDVLNRRDDGYHNVETILQSVSLHDTLRFTLSRENVISLDTGDANLGPREENLVYKAAALLRDRYSCSKGAEINLEKNIPVAAGLAGGSADAAATLHALNRLWELGLTTDRLLEHALELGSDVPFCLRGGSASAAGRGERLERLPQLPTTWLVLVSPRLAVSTGSIYNSPHLATQEGPPPEGKTRRFLKAIGQFNDNALDQVLFNAMESAVFALHPEVGELKARILDASCAASLMSGSGPTLFGLCESETHAHSVAGKFADVPISVATTIPHGIEPVD